jgi:outer membrane protein assembly factor BamB
VHIEGMTAGLPIIDLDVAPPSVVAEPRSLRSRLAVPRPFLLVGAVGLALTLGAAAPPANRLRPILSAEGTPAAAFVLGPDSLYTAQYGNNPNSEAAVRGYDLTNGTLRWAVALPQNVQNLEIDPRSRVLMARSGTEPKITFLDSESGATLWHVESPNTSVVRLAGGAVLMRTGLTDTETSLRLADARTGREIWARTVDPTAELGPDDLYGDAPSRIVAIAATGEVAVLRWADGAVLSEGNLQVRLPMQADYNSGVSDYIGVSTVGDRVYVSRRDNGKASMIAYSTIPLIQLWRAEDGPVGSVIDCAEVLCVADTRFVSGVDPATGAVRWTAPEFSSAARYDASQLIAYDQQEMPQSAVLDSATGEVLERLGQTVRVGALLLRTDIVIPGRAWVAVVDPADGATHTVGSVGTGAPYGCEVRDAYLACPTTAGPTTVWRVP